MRRSWGMPMLQLYQGEGEEHAGPRVAARAAGFGGVDLVLVVAGAGLFGRDGLVADLQGLPHHQAQGFGVGAVVVEEALGVAGQVVAGRDGFGEVGQGAFDDDGEELVLVAEVVVDRTLVGLGRGGDTVHPGAG